MNDDAKKRILARRARFVAAAIAGMGINVAACSEAQACLEPAIPPGDSAASDSALDGSDTKPQPCLDPIVDSGIDSSIDAVDAFDDADTEPAACLKMAPDSGPDGD